MTKKKKPICKDCGETNPEKFYRSVRNRCRRCSLIYSKNYWNKRILYKKAWEKLKNYSIKKCDDELYSEMVKIESNLGI